MLSDTRLNEIQSILSKASASPWDWSFTCGEVPTDIPELLRIGISTEPTEPRNIQLRAKGTHRFWIVFTDTKLAGNVVYDLDFIKESRTIVPELIAEIKRLRAIINKDCG